MTTLFLLAPTQLMADAVLHGAGPDPGRSDPVMMLETEMDFWEGDDVIEFADPWFLMTERLTDSVRQAGLTGLHIATIPSLRYSDVGRVRAALGEFFAPELPEFRLVSPLRAVRVSTLAGEEDGFSRDDELRYDGWEGDDFSRSAFGPVVSARAREVLESHDIHGSQFWPLSPR